MKGSEQVSTLEVGVWEKESGKVEVGLLSSLFLFDFLPSDFNFQEEESSKT